MGTVPIAGRFFCTLRGSAARGVQEVDPAKYSVRQTIGSKKSAHSLSLHSAREKCAKKANAGQATRIYDYNNLVCKRLDRPAVQHRAMAGQQVFENHRTIRYKLFIKRIAHVRFSVVRHLFDKQR